MGGDWVTDIRVHFPVNICSGIRVNRCPSVVKSFSRGIVRSRVLRLVFDTAALRLQELNARIPRGGSLPES